MKQFSKQLKRIGYIVIALIMLMSVTVLPTSAEGESFSNVTEATKGVFLVVYTRKPSPDPDAPDQIVRDECFSAGTGFLINENTVITAYHVLHENTAKMEKMYGRDWKNKMQLRVYYKSGAFVKATEIQQVANSSFDFTAIQLAHPINGAMQLKLAENINSETLPASTPVYALGYPYTSVFYEEAGQSTFTPKDVDIRNGIVSKFSPYEGIEHIKHTCAVLEGMSGGPVLNSNGEVVGVTRMGRDAAFEEDWAVNIANVIDSLKQMNISYNSGSFNTPESETTNSSESTTRPNSPEPATDNIVDYEALERLVDEVKNMDSKKYSNWETIVGTLRLAEDMIDSRNSTQDEVDSMRADLQKAKNDLIEKSISVPLIIGIAVGAVLLIVLVAVVLILVSKKNKKTAPDVPAFNPAGIPNNVQAQQNPFPPVGGINTGMGNNETTVLGGNANETTLLGGNANETTMLGVNAPYAKLLRRSNNAIIDVAGSPFIIGKDRSKSNYCIDDNTTISRKHAQIVRNGASVSVIDLGSKNGTFVNGVRSQPQFPVNLNDGDRITLSDEEFIINFI